MIVLATIRWCKGAEKGGLLKIGDEPTTDRINLIGMGEMKFQMELT